MRERVFLALAHHPTLDREGRVVTTAVTSLDLHDFCRLAKTYGLGGVYAMTPLEGQRALVQSLLEHWTRGHGSRINPCRRVALEGLAVAPSLTEAEADVTRRLGTPPLVVGTSARCEASRRVGFEEARERLAEDGRPMLLVFGTGWGLAPEALQGCNWLLEPIIGAGKYNHLSVRSAAAIIVDRLFRE